MSIFAELPERVATLEEQNRACHEERKEHGEALSELRAASHKIQGGIRVLVVLWAIATSAVGLAAAKYFAHPAQAAISK